MRADTPLAPPAPADAAPGPACRAARRCRACRWWDPHDPSDPASWGVCALAATDDRGAPRHPTTRAFPWAYGEAAVLFTAPDHGCVGWAPRGGDGGRASPASGR